MEKLNLYESTEIRKCLKHEFIAFTPPEMRNSASRTHVMRACDAILKHCEKVIKWPSIEEWWNISGRIRKVHGFINCIGLINGTLFPLAFALAVNGEDYYTIKGDYAIKGLVICDDAARITWIEVGWLGGVHDNQVWSNSEIYLGRDKYFDHKEYITCSLFICESSVKSMIGCWAMFSGSFLELVNLLQHA